MTDELRGVFCANVTPFRADTGAIDTEWLQAHLAWLAAQGIDGIVPMGTTGEGPSLTLDERHTLLDTIWAHRGSLTVVPCTGCATLADTLALSRSAVDKGMTTVMVMPPFYYKNVPSAGVLAYYRAVCDALPPTARLLLYHIPQVTAVPITAEVIGGLVASHPHQLYGLKDSSGDRDYLRLTRRTFPQLRVFVGHEPTAADGLAEGAVGLISGMANVFAAAVRSVYQTHADGSDVASAQARLTALAQVIGGYQLPAVMKAAVPWVSDLAPTSVRVPLCNLGDVETAALHESLTELGGVPR